MSRTPHLVLTYVVASLLTSGCATLGYGDVTPASPYARWLAQVEAVFGQLYIAILIAALVGNWIVLATIRDTKDDDRSRQ